MILFLDIYTEAYAENNLLRDHRLEDENKDTSKTLGSSQPRIEPKSPTLQVDSLPSEPPEKPLFLHKCT